MDDEWIYIYSRKGPYKMERRRRKYGLMAFIFDCIMTFATCGLWLIWVFCRESRG